MSSESTSQPQEPQEPQQEQQEPEQEMTEISAERGEQILSLLQVQGEDGSGHETIQLVTTTGDGEGMDEQGALLLQSAIEVNGERHVILQQAQDPNTGEVLVFLQGENGETVCLPPEALNANIVQMGDGSGQVYTLALPSDADGSSVMVVAEGEGGEGGEEEDGSTLVTDETLGNVMIATSSAGTIDLGGTIETIVTSTGETFNLEQLAGEVASLASSSSGTQVVQSVVGPLMATSVSSDSGTTTSTTTIQESETTTTTTTTKTTATENNENEEISVNITTSNANESEMTVTTSTEEATEEAAAAAAGVSGELTTTIVEEISSISNTDDINSKLNEAVSKLGEEREMVDESLETVETNNMNYGSAVIQVQDANSTTSFDSLVANAMLAAGESNYVIMTTGEDGELPKEINLADVINAGSASGQTIFLQTSEGLVACQAATTGEDGSLQIVADGSGNAIAVSTNSNTTSSSFSESTSGQTLAYTLSSTSSGIELTPVTNVMSTPNAPSSTTTRNNQVSSVSSRSRLSRQPKPRSNIPTPTSTLASSSSLPLSSFASSLASSSAAATTTIGETLLLPSKHLVSSPNLSSGLNHNTSNNSSSTNNSASGFTFNSNSINMNTNSRRRTLTNRGRSNISVSITPSSTATSSLSTTSSSPIIPVQPDAIHSSSSDFSTLTKSSSSSDPTTTDSSILTDGVSRPSQLSASRRTYSKKNNIVWLNPESTTITKRSSSSTTTTTSSNLNSLSNSNDGKSSDENESVVEGGDSSKTIENNNDSKMIDLPVDTMNDISLTTSTGISNSPTSSSSLSTTTSATSSSFSSSKLTVKPPTTPLTVSNVPTLRTTKKLSEPIIKSSSITSITTTTTTTSTPSVVTPLSPPKSTTPISAMVSKDYSRVISTNVDKIVSTPTTSTLGVPSMIKVAAVPQLGRVVTPPVKITSPVKPNSPIKVTSPTIGKITSPTGKVTSPTKIGSPTKTQQPIESTSDIDLDFGVTDDTVQSPSRSPSKKVTSPVRPLSSPSLSPSKVNTREGESESDSEYFVRKQVTFDDLLALAATPLNSMKSPTRNNQQTSKQNDSSATPTTNVTNKLVETDTPKTRSRKRLSESESGSDQVTVAEDNVKSMSNSETGTPLKKRVNFTLAGESGENEVILSSPTKELQSTSAETPNTRSRKRKSDIETMADLSDQMTTDNNVLTVASSTESSVPPPKSTSVACTPPPKKRFNIALDQSNDDNDLFATPMSPSKSPRRDDHQSSSLKASSSIVTPTGPTSKDIEGQSSSSILDTPISETRSTRSSRKRRAESEVETASSADESFSTKEDSFSSTPAKKRVNFAPGTSIEVIRDNDADDDEDAADEDGDDDDSDPVLSVDEKKKEKRLSGRKRSPVHRPLSSSASSLESPQPILKMNKRNAVDSSPLMLHFGSDSNENESEGVGGDDDEGTLIKELLESRGPSEYFDFTINGCCFHIRHQSGRLTPFSPNESEGNYACLNNCGYRTSRMNNIILHNKDQCTVIKMQWQNEIQHLINRQRLMNQDDQSNPSTPTTSPKKATTPKTTTTTAAASNSDSDPTVTQDEEEETAAPTPVTHSSASPTREPLVSETETETEPTTETEAVTETPEAESAPAPTPTPVATE